MYTYTHSNTYIHTSRITHNLLRSLFRPAMTDETEADKAEETQSAKPSKEAKDKSVRINFLLDKARYKKLAILSVLEDKSLTELLKEGIDLCIAAHETQAAIAEHAVTQSAAAKSE